MTGVGGSSGSGFGGSSTKPSEETLTLVMEAGMASPLLDFRLVRNLVGESSLRRLMEDSLGRLRVDARLPAMLSAAVFTMAGALDRQLADPASHLLPCEVVDAVDAATDFSERPSCSESLSLGGSGCASGPQAADGAWAPLSVEGAGGMGFVLLRALIARHSVKVGRERQAGGPLRARQGVDIPSA